MKCELCFDDCLDLPSLTQIQGNGDGALQGGNRDNRKTMINGHKSYDNTLIMKSMYIEMKWNMNFVLMIV